MGRRLASLLVPVEEQLADELSHRIMEEAVAETMATLRNVGAFSAPPVVSPSR